MGRKCTIFALFYFVFECKFQAPQGGLHLEGRFNGGFLRYDFEGLIFGRAYTWRGLFSEFYGNSTVSQENGQLQIYLPKWIKWFHFIAFDFAIY